jgi:hypothetical protein
MLYYPFTPDNYWWSIVLLLRPTVIAVTFNARNRGTGLIQEVVDWRLMVIFYLLIYITVQVSFGPFKLQHESQLDIICVAMVVAIFAVDIHNDLSTVGSDSIFLVVVTFCSAVILIIMTVRGRYITKRLIK